MKIVHITTYTSGGAGIAALRLHGELLQQGVDSKVVCLKRECTGIPEVYLFPDKSIGRKLLSKIGFWPMLRHRHHKTMMQLRKKANASFYYSFPNTEYNILRHPLVQEADIIHLHWIAGFVDYNSFFKNVQKPVVWTFHDYNPMLGGLHYPQNDSVEHYTTVYDQAIQNCKIEAYSFINDLTVLCLSSLMRKMVQSYPPLRQANTVLIHNGIEPSSFYPRPNRNEIRRKLGVLNEQKMILFVSYSLHDPVKGCDRLLAAYHQLHLETTVLVMIGNTDDTTSIRCQKPYIHSNALADPSSLADYYSAADLFVMPSLFETFAQTPIEALMCGCPTVMTPVSGSDDIINDHNGVIAADYTAEAVREAMEEALSKSYDRKQIAAETAACFSISLIASQVCGVYDAILNKKGTQ